MTGPPFAGAVLQELRLERRATRTRVLAIVLLAIVALQYGSEAAQGSLGFGLGMAAATDGLMFAIALLAPLPPAIAQAAQRELGLDRERHLDGLSARRLAAAIALASIATVTAVVAVSLAIGGLTGAIDAEFRELRPGGATAAPAGGQVLEGIVATIAAAAAMAGIGASVGILCRTRLAAVLAATVIAGAVLGLERVATVYSSIEDLVDATPQGASLSLMEQAGSSGSRLSLAFSAAVLVAWVLVAALFADRDLRRRPAGARPRRPRAQGMLRTGRAVAVMSVLALPVGYVAPVAMRDEVPWYLRPQWIGDQLQDRASDDVVRAYLRAVAAGDEPAARRLTVAQAGSRLLGPFRREVAVHHPKLPVRTLEMREERPGTAVIDLPDGGLAAQLKVCMTRRAGRWQVQSVSSSGVCG